MAAGNGHKPVPFANHLTVLEFQFPAYPPLVWSSFPYVKGEDKRKDRQNKLRLQKDEIKPFEIQEKGKKAQLNVPTETIGMIV
jgi:hypothetical protein